MPTHTPTRRTATPITMGILYASAWTAATLANKEKALVMATRVIDAEYQFSGVRATATQALQWPRASVRDPDGEDDLASNAVPVAVRDATGELARALLIVDRTAAPAGEGLKYENVGGAQVGYDKSDTRPVIPALVQALLAKYGALINRKSGAVRLLRV